MLIYPCICVYIEQAPLHTISSVWVCYLPLHIRCSSVLALQMSLSPADAAFCCRSLQVLCNKQQIGQLFVCAPVLKAEWLQALETIQPPKQQGQGAWQEGCRRQSACWSHQPTSLTQKAEHTQIGRSSHMLQTSQRIRQHCLKCKGSVMVVSLVTACMLIE